MAAYTVHEPISPSAGVLARADAVRFVKEGTAWWALAFPVLWLIYHRMWIVLVGYVLLLLLLQFGLGFAGFSETVIGWCMIALGVLFAVEANDLRRWTLARRGYRMIAAVTGHDLVECELKFFGGWPEAEPAPAQPEARAGAAAKGRPDADEEVIGLFPEPGR